MTLLTIIRTACDLLSITRPTAVVNSTDQQIRQLYALANEEGADLASSFNWQKLVREYTFLTTADPVQIAAVPDDWDRFMPNSFWNRTQIRPVYGPITPQRWQAIKAMPQVGYIWPAFRQRDDEYLMTPTPPEAQTIAYEYSSKNWALSAADEPLPQFENDTDTTYLSEQLITYGIRWRWKAAKGLPYGEEMKTYETQKAQVQARDGGSTAITTAGSGNWGDGWLANIPSGNFPGG